MKITDIKCLSILFMLFFISIMLVSAQERPGEKIIPTIFWTWQDSVIDNPGMLSKQLNDIKAHGFEGVYAMLRGTHYQLFDEEMINAVKIASDSCLKEGIEFNMGPDPRLTAHKTVNKPGLVLK